MPTTPLEHDYIGLGRGSSSSSSPPSTSSSSSSSDENEKKKSMKETELRLGLPGSDSSEGKNSACLFGKDLEERSGCVKRGFCELAGGSWLDNNGSEPSTVASSTPNKACSVSAQSPTAIAKEDKKTPLLSSHHASPPASKAQVVGWPPIRSFRKNSMASNSLKNNDGTDDDKSGLYIKVSMDGAPYLRKVDLLMCKNYIELSSALEKMFGGFTTGKCGSTRVPERKGLTETPLMNLLHGSEYVVTYEDKDGDWMLVGDVPWEMFICTCRRLRIMKGSEANGLAPRAIEKCKSRN